MAALWVLVTTTLLTLHRATSAPIVDAPWGRIRGLDSVSVSGLNYSSYLAIPFALPPVGELRFAKPVAHPGYGEGRVFNATFPGTQCLQVYDPTYGVGMSEDCLTLNVFVPVSPSNGECGVSNNRILRHNSRFIYNLLIAPRTVSNTRSSGPGAQITCNTSRVYHVQHVVLRATWYEGAAQLFSLTEFKSHLFELSFYWLNH